MKVKLARPFVIETRSHYIERAVRQCSNLPRNLLQTLCSICAPENGACGTMQKCTKQHYRLQLLSVTFGTGAMVEREWTSVNCELRHVITRLGVHGFHHLLCRDETFHDPTDSCVCNLCERQCEKYHIERCRKRTKSICEYAKQGCKT